MQKFSFLRWGTRLAALAIALTAAHAFAATAASSAAVMQSASGNIAGIVVDPTGAAIPGAAIELKNSVSGYTQSTTTDSSGHFHFSNLPFNPYRITATYSGFAPGTAPVQVSSGVSVAVQIALKVATSDSQVTVDAPEDLVETDPHAHTDIDRSMIAKLPIDQPSSALSSIVTSLAPGVAADSNGLMHGMGDHNEVSFSIDGQPVTDQQSKVFSNQVPADAIQSLEVIEGAPPAEYGDKTSLVVVGTTRSGQGVTKPTGTVTFQYGTFGTSNLSVDTAYGGANWGNFIAVSGLQSGRFLDAPEFAVFHDKGNEENFFDRADRQIDTADSIHVNLQYTRSWFQTPNSYDTQYGYVQSGLTTASTDQRSKIETINASPTYTRIINDSIVFNFAPYVRRDAYNYNPSRNALNDFGPIQQESVAQYRTLTNAGLHTDLSYVKGVNNVKVGGMYSQTFLRENDQLGIVDPALNAACFNALGGPIENPSQCTAGDPVNPKYNPVLVPYNLTAGGSAYTFHGHTDIKQLALYGEDEITAGHWIINAGIRGDIYNGLAIQRQAEPRLGLSYKMPKTGTVLRASYARTQETPFNENLVLSSHGCLDPVLNGIFTLTYGYCNPAPFNPGFRNEIHAGFQQSAGRFVVFSADYITKYTHNAYDFSVLGNTPITFPIEWHNSKIPGYTGSATLTPIKGLSARVTFSSVAARFFNPQVGGVGASIAQQGSAYPFRIDHDERFNEGTHIAYNMPFRKSLYYEFNWRYDSGMVASATPCYNVTDPNSICNPANGGPSVTINGQPGVNLRNLTYDEQFQAGLACNGVRATYTTGFTQCLASQLTSSLVTIPVPGTEDDDHNPQRIQPRSVFDMSVGDDKIAHFGSDRYLIGARLTAINLTDKYALYNFLSTFSGTHYLTPRTLTAEVDFHF